MDAKLLKGSKFICRWFFFFFFFVLIAVVVIVVVAVDVFPVPF